jgi:hypothetical protein
VKSLISLVLIGSIVAKDIPNTHEPQMKNQLHIDFEDYIPTTSGKINIIFYVDKQGRVVNPIISDTFDIKLNNTIIDAVSKLRFIPAKQNGTNVIVKYNLPIVVQ